MDSSSVSYSVTPANQKCQTATTVNIVSNPGTTASGTSSDLDSVLNQSTADQQYDVSSSPVKKLYGGRKINIYNLYKIKFKKKMYNIKSNNEINALKLFLNGRIFKSDNIITINNSLYILRGNYKNKFVKISD